MTTNDAPADRADDEPVGAPDDPGDGGPAHPPGGQVPAAVAPRWRQAGREVVTGSVGLTVLAVLLALLVGAVLIAAADPQVQATAGYFFARPSDFGNAVLSSVGGAYSALFSGAVVDVHAATFARAIRPLTETMTVATPLILAGLGLGVAFRSGLFNIGAQGQVVLGAVLGGALWAAVAGVLKARTGANEVIVTIMLNNVAGYLIAYLLAQSAFQRPGSNNPQSPAIASTAVYPLLLGPQFRLHAGFLVAVAAAVGCWWLMERCTLGFKFRAVGENPDAARTAGISVATVTVWVMVIAGALAGLAGSAQILGTESDNGLTAGIAATVGIDAITVALLGRSRPLGVVLAGLLFGALRAGGVVMQAKTQTPIDLVLVVQSLIVLFIAAPPLVRAVFRLPGPGTAVTGDRPAQLTAKEVRA